MALDPRFAKSRFSTGVKRATTSDPRYAPSVRQGAPEPRRYPIDGRGAGTGHDSDLATRRARFAESAERMQYKKSVVVAQRGRGRGE